MKGFNYDLAKAGLPVCTRERKPVRIICWDARTLYRDDKYPIVALIDDGDEEYINTYGIDGYVYSGREDPDDLMMVPAKYEGWINVYKDSKEIRSFGNRFFGTLSDAEEEGKKSEDYITSIKIEWEE